MGRRNRHGVNFPPEFAPQEIMGQCITLYGRPGAGKLATAVMMAKDFSEAYDLDVVILLANNYEPKVPIIFPKGKLLSDKESLGPLIISPTLSDTEVLKALIPLPHTHEKVFALGYKNGDNPFAFTAPVMSQMKEFFAILKGLSDVVISVPSALFWTDELSKFMMAESDLFYFVHELSPQGLSFYKSGIGNLAPYIKCDRVDILNKIEKEDAGLITAYEEEIGAIKFKLPYVAELNRNYKNGNIGANLTTSDGREFVTEISRVCGHALGRKTGRKRKGGKSNGKLSRA
jgi:hypothetical protein